MGKSRRPSPCSPDSPIPRTQSAPVLCIPPTPEIFIPESQPESDVDSDDDAVAGSPRPWQSPTGEPEYSRTGPSRGASPVAAVERFLPAETAVTLPGGRVLPVLVVCDDGLPRTAAIARVDPQIRTVLVARGYIWDEYALDFMMAPLATRTTEYRPLCINTPAADPRTTRRLVCRVRLPPPPLSHIGPRLGRGPALGPAPGPAPGPGPGSARRSAPPEATNPL